MAKSLARGGLALAVATVLANGLGYLFTAVIARAFTEDEYGAFGALLGVALIGVVPSNALQFVVARRVAADRLARDRNERAVLRLAVLIGILLTVVGIALAPVSAAFLHLDSAWPAVWLAVMLAPYTVCGALQGSLLGHERYVAFAGGQVWLAATRFAAGVVAAAFGMSVAGAMAAIFVATVVAVAGLWVVSGPSSWRPGPGAGLPVDLARSASAIAGVVVLSNVDLLLARHYLAGDESGTYALASLFAKVCLWGGSFVPMTVFPTLSRDGASRGLLLRAAGVTAAAGGVGVLAAAVAAEPIVSAVGGEGSYAGAADLAVAFAVLGTLWALVQLALLAAVAGGDSRPGRLLWVLVAVEAAAVAFGPHGSPRDIVTVCLVVTALMAGAVVLLDVVRAREPVSGDRAGG